MTDFVYPEGYQLFAGVDEVGRGPLVGAVVTAAVILDPNNPIAGLADSKKLSEKKRLALAAEIKAVSYTHLSCQKRMWNFAHLKVIYLSLKILMLLMQY